VKKATKLKKRGRLPGMKVKEVPMAFIHKLKKISNSVNRLSTQIDKIMKLSDK